MPSVRRCLPLVLLVVIGCAANAPQPELLVVPPPGGYQWAKLDTAPFKGKQDDIYFVDPQLGWYVNGTGKIYKTTDGGATWALKLDKPGTYFRCIAFLDAKRGFAGNIGTDYYPNVSDTTPLYETRDGGDTWTAVTRITGPTVKGLCAIDVLRDGNGKVHLYAGGRVGSPTFLMVSHDAGETWISSDLSAYGQMILDVKFFDTQNGLLCSATTAAAKDSNALILGTTDGGKTWTKRYQSSRPWEITWKMSFPTREIGYVTIQNYNPDKTDSRRYVAKTVDGGNTWTELLLVDDHPVREFGVAFIDRNTGWIGSTTTGFETTDGGATWKRVELGKAVNKIRLLRDGAGFVGYAIGSDVYKLDATR